MSLCHSWRMVCLSVHLIALLACCSDARAQFGSAETVATLDGSLRGWMEEHYIAAASLAVMKNKVIVGSFGYGGMSPAKPAAPDRPARAQWFPDDQVQQRLDGGCDFEGDARGGTPELRRQFDTRLSAH
jgi:hypothetical protein